MWVVEVVYKVHVV